MPVWNMVMSELSGSCMSLLLSLIHIFVIPGTVQMKMALGENPKKFYGDMKKQPPMTRMMTAAMLRETLAAAVEYSEALREAEKKGEKPPKKDMKLAALVPVVRGEMRVRIHCHRCDDIYTAIRISEEFEMCIRDRCSPASPAA